MKRVPVLASDGTPLMPTKPSRARRWLKDGKAVVAHNDLDVFCVQLVTEPSGYEMQPIVIGIDPGKRFSGIGVQSARTTVFIAHLILPFKNITQKMSGRRFLRRARRGRRINRKIAFHLRAHRQKRFTNRRRNKLSPSIRANRELELRVVKELMQLFPISHIVYECVKAQTNKGKGKSFSPVMVGQYKMVEWLKQLCPMTTQEGWQTASLRRQLNLEKDKTNKAAPKPSTHAVDGIALAASYFIQFKAFHTNNSRGHHWVGKVQVTLAPFRVIARSQIFRRQLHFENPVSNTTNYRRRKGGTLTPFGFRSGDFVKAEKAGKTYMGWIGGFTQTEKTKKVSIYDYTWRRIGQFSPNKVHLLQRRTGIVVAKELNKSLTTP